MEEKEKVNRKQNILLTLGFLVLICMVVGVSYIFFLFLG